MKPPDEPGPIPPQAEPSEAVGVGMFARGLGWTALVIVFLSLGGGVVCGMTFNP